MNDLITKHTSEIDNIIKTQAISYLAVFGSVARGEQRRDSDVDLLVDYSKRVGLIHHAKTKLLLEKVLKRTVDLVTPGSMNKRLEPFIKKDLKVIYE
jgi:predicted nucleotidyltransferase